MQKLGVSLCILLGLLAAGCGGAMGRAVHDFESTRYPESLEALQHMEHEAQNFEPSARARYCLYRGLTHLAVGNARLAGRWLGRARQELGEDPSRLSGVDKSRLESAWRTMGLMPGDPVVTD